MESAKRNKMASTEKKGQNVSGRTKCRKNETKSERWVLTKALFTAKSLFLPNIHPRYSHTHCPQIVTFNPPRPHWTQKEQTMKQTQPVTRSLTNYSFQFNIQSLNPAFPPCPHRGAAAEARSGAARWRILLHSERTSHGNHVPWNWCRDLA